MKEEEEYEKKLKERFDNLQQEHNATVERFNTEREELRRRIRKLGRECSSQSKHECSIQESRPMNKPEVSKQETREVSKQAVKSE
ncbi:hypothetical protein Q1695_015656 [Nippostrongylus brasiliensis]|nr:hypothetical protein Q1695_015656 [Nippostrongylus brasiliensis]